jgi:hypothetical protein
MAGDYHASRSLRRPEIRAEIRLLLYGMIVFEPATLDVRGILLVVLADQPFAPIVELFGLERLLLRLATV